MKQGPVMSSLASAPSCTLEVLEEEDDDVPMDISQPSTCVGSQISENISGTNINIADGGASWNHAEVIKTRQASLLSDNIYEQNILNKAWKENMFVVLDCANIGWTYGVDKFDATGVFLAIDFFKKFADINVVAMLPAAFLRHKPRDGTRGNAKMDTEEQGILNNLVTGGSLTVVPSGDKDDAYILSFAKQKDGFIVSNDFFADHVEDIHDEQLRGTFSAWLTKRRVGYTFVGREFMLNPESDLIGAMTGATHYTAIGADLGGFVGTMIIADGGGDNLATAAAEACERRLFELEQFFARCGHGAELKYIVLARSTMFFRSRRFLEAQTELLKLLRDVDTLCVDAKRLLELCYAQLQPDSSNSNNTNITNNNLHNMSARP